MGLKCKIIKNKDSSILEVNINKFLEEMTFDQIVTIEYVNSKGGYYSVLIIYSEKINDNTNFEEHKI